MSGDQGRFVWVIGPDGKAAPQAGADRGLARQRLGHPRWPVGWRPGHHEQPDEAAPRRSRAGGRRGASGVGRLRRRQLTGTPMFSRFFIERPVFATVLAIIIVLAGLVSARVAAGGAVPGDRAAHRHDHRHLPRRFGRDPGAHRGRTDRGAAVGRREPAVLQLQLGLQRPDDDHRHLRRRHRHRQGHLQRQQPRAARHAAPARRGAAQRRAGGQALEQLPARRCGQLARPVARHALPVELRDAEHRRRVEARAGRGRRLHLRRA